MLRLPPFMKEFVMRRCWSIAEVVVFGVIAACVLITGCSEGRERSYRGDDRPRQEVIIERDRPRREVIIERDRPRREVIIERDKKQYKGDEDRKKEDSKQKEHHD
jgi:hypothetical protein